MTPKTERLGRAPRGAGCGRSGGMIALLTADMGSAWVLIFRTPACEIRILAAGDDGRRTGTRPRRDGAGDVDRA